ncbi:methyltransferase domain-containing protein [Candidatus Pacearchaeota archaeon]|nr:methyltransferase domain-containing protein [Candidatus Pacearchaeota archaeon]
MKRFEDNRLENTYESENLLVRMYFRWKINITVWLANLKKDDVILDFGCGGGWLEKKLKNYKIFGYDTNPKKTFIKDYRKIKPTKIFALDVFEHIPIKETKKILANFKKMSKNFYLIVSQPTENWLSRKIRKLVGKEEVPKEHITRYEEIIKLLKKEFEFRRKINFFTITHIFKFRHKKINI